MLEKIVDDIVKYAILKMCNKEFPKDDFVGKALTYLIRKIGKDLDVEKVRLRKVEANRRRIDKKIEERKRLEKENGKL